MHHVALDRPGPDDRHLDHQVVEAAGFKPRQHRHLRPALHLEDADGIRLAQHVVDGRILGRHGGKRQRAPAVALDQLERLAHAGQHAERQDVDLQNAERVEVLLVPLEHRALGHRRVLDRHHFAERALGDHHAAGVLREVAGKADQFAGEIDDHAQGGISGVETDARHVRRHHLVPVAAPEHALQRGDRIVGQAERLRHLAERHLRAVADDGRGHPGMVAAILGVDVLDHLLAALVLEVDVDVRRLVALGADEALEQEVGTGRIDGGDAEAVADGGVGGRAATLAEDAALAGEADDFVDGQEVGGEAELLDRSAVRARPAPVPCRAHPRDNARRRPPRRDEPAPAAACGRPEPDRPGIRSAVRRARSGSAPRSPACGQ